MISMFRTTALAAAFTLGCIGVQAAPVPINLDLLGETAFTSGAPVAVGTVQGFVFGNAFAYRDDMLQTGDLAVPKGTQGTFIMNDDRIDDGSFKGIQIRLGSSYVNNSRFFESLSMDVFSLGSVGISWFKRGNTSDVADGNVGLSNPTTGTWSPWTKGTNWNAVEEIDRIEFTAGPSAYFGIQGLRVGLTAGTDPNPNPAPEPASYALVGLALLAAGVASRRRA